MPLEIERRFLVRENHSLWTSDGVEIVQGYIPARSGGNIRIRLTTEGAVMTIKRWVSAGVRSERNLPIPLGSAFSLLQSRCTGGVVQKVRHKVQACGRLWEVDIFRGENEGLIIAEVELDHPGQEIQLPPWIAEEITGDRRYGNSMLARCPYRTWAARREPERSRRTIAGRAPLVLDRPAPALKASGA